MTIIKTGWQRVRKRLHARLNGQTVGKAVYSGLS